MSFSMPSYFLGVGTVVGALALGFGGGIVLTKTAIKDTPAGPSRIERVARSEPAAPVVTEAKAIPVPHVDQPAVQPVIQAAPNVQAPNIQAAADNPKPVVSSNENPSRHDEPVKQPDAPKIEQPIRQADVKQVEQPIRQTEAKPTEQKDSAARTSEREQRRAEKRRIDREKRLAERERKAKAAIIAQRQRPLEEQEQQPARAQLAFEREETRPNLFEGLFGRPEGASGWRD